MCILHFVKMDREWFSLDVTGNLGSINVRTIFIFATVFMLWKWMTQKPFGIPPGPSLMLPMVGNLPLLVSGDVLGVFKKLRKVHGDIFSFYMGKQLLIVLNGYDVIHKSMVRNGEMFSGRPHNYMGDVFAKGKGIIFTDGDLWKQQRKFVTNSLQEFGFGKSVFENKIILEVSNFLKILGDSNGQPFDIIEPLHVSVANVVVSILCGRRHGYDDEIFLKLINGSRLASKELPRVSVLDNCFPFLKYLPWNPTKFTVMMDNFKLFRTLVSGWYQSHIDHMTPNKDSRDLIDCYIKEVEARKQNGEDYEFSYDQLEMCIMDLFGAGSETSATTISWALLHLMRNPDVKARLQQDIDSVLEGKRNPSLQDREKLPYVEAFIMEVLRTSNVAPLAVPHSILGNQEITFMGYRFPKDSSIVVNLDSVLMDPDVFPDPNVFNPSRFLDPDDKVLKPREFIPFGIGRRVCLGEIVARMELFLFLTAMLKHFDFLPPEGEPVPKLDGVLGVTYFPKPYKVRVLPRNYI